MDGYFFMILTSAYSVIQLSSKQQSFATPKIIHIFGIFNHVFIMPEDKLKEELRKAILTDFRFSDFS